jgi:hypothetical protein
MSILPRNERTLARRLTSAINWVVLAFESGVNSGGTLTFCLTPNRLAQPLDNNRLLNSNTKPALRASVFLCTEDKFSINEKDNPAMTIKK